MYFNFFHCIKHSVLILIIAGTLFESCDSYQKVLRSDDLDYKYQKAEEYYADGDYFKAIPLYEELITVYKGTQAIEEISYHYAYCHYGLGDYIVAAFYFKEFTKSFPRNKYAEDAQFQYAYCYYLSSPAARLDQTYTYKAINAFQLFISIYPNSEKVEECNILIDQLRSKLEKKALRNAILYYNLEKYKAATESFKQILKDFPNIEDKERIYFLTLQSFYNLASNSVPEKRAERYQQTISAYYTLIDKYPDTKYAKEAEKIYKEAVNNT